MPHPLASNDVYIDLDNWLLSLDSRGSGRFCFLYVVTGRPPDRVHHAGSLRIPGPALMLHADLMAQASSVCPSQEGNTLTGIPVHGL